MRWLPPERGAAGATGGWISDCSCELVEGSCNRETSERVDAEFVVTASQVLHERVALDDHAGGPVRLEAAHRTEPGLEAAVVGLHKVVGVLGRVMVRA